MISNDLLHRFIFDDCDIRGEVVTLGSSYQEILSHNDYPKVVQALLGEFVAAVALLSSTLKFDGVVTLQARGAGALSLVMAECSHHNEVRAIVRPAANGEIDADAATLSDLLGEGVLTITLDPAQGERYQGVVPLDADNVAGCLEHYFRQSEQLKTRFWLAADDSTASGLLLQALPQQLSASTEANAEQWRTTVALADTVSGEELLRIDHNQLLYRLFNEQPLRLFSPSEVRFACSCSRERSAEALKSLGQDDVEQLLIEKGEIEIDCQFCNQFYRYKAADIRALFGPGTLH
ncbi:Hsp33 family molecular chaperone HslO [Gilvimarinus polysaccharolyticus]|uniref:Hsp33 family molecular chaperone HslO n=1 Tax=Gilvimarinus polysaccharolyticus TaxID=863921 RepID=UPI0006730D8A|nr:Hsp33 family molecular chaperone HslO [Gilvimarinus polysaccharolyticus]